jgi:hypothetical protein
MRRGVANISIIGISAARIDKCLDLWQRRAFVSGAQELHSGPHDGFTAAARPSKPA